MDNRAIDWLAYGLVIAFCAFFLWSVLLAR